MRADLVSVEVLFSREQTALGKYQILLCPKITSSQTEEGKANDGDEGEKGG